MQREKQFDNQLENSVLKIVSRNGDSEGTGFFVDEYGHFLTCYHVIKKMLLEPFVEYKEKKHPAHYIPLLSNPDKDIAVLKVEIAKHAWLPVGEADLDREVGAFGFRRRWHEGYCSTGTLRR